MDDNSNKWRCCPLCARPYTMEVPTTEEITRSRREAFHSAVPVQSSLCSHVLCFSCIRKKAQSLQIDIEDVENPSCFVDCPICEKRDAFDTKNPIISSIACDLLKLVQKTTIALTGSQTVDARNDSLSSDHDQIDLESNVAEGSVKLCTLYSGQRDTRNNDLKINQDSKISKYKPEILIFTQEPTLINPKSIQVKHENDDESIAEENVTPNNSSAHHTTTSTSIPGAFAVEGPRLNSADQDASDTFGSLEHYNNEVLVQATLVEPPPPEPEMYTAYAVPLLPFREKYKWVLRGGFGAAIVVLVVALAITIPRAQRNRDMTSIALQTSNQNSTKMLGVPQRTALDWVLGPNNIHYNPARDRNQIAQRYILMTLYYSTGGKNWTQNNTMLSKGNECDWYDSVNCSEFGLVTKIQLGE